MDSDCLGNVTVNSWTETEDEVIEDKLSQGQNLTQASVKHLNDMIFWRSQMYISKIYIRAVMNTIDRIPELGSI